MANTVSLWQDCGKSYKKHEVFYFILYLTTIFLLSNFIKNLFLDYTLNQYNLRLHNEKIISLLHGWPERGAKRHINAIFQKNWQKHFPKMLVTMIFDFLSNETRYTARRLIGSQII
jgi:hypothetical protein